jgi:pimeloyl-ACP methyl ester carboxylesterase
MLSKRGRWLVEGSVVFLVVVAAIVFKTFGPISTPAFRDSNDRPVANSIAVVERWRVNGIDESVILRGRDLNNPVLVWLHGGPGSSETSLLRVMNGALEDHFTVVYWDQRLAGQTLDPLAAYPESLTIAQMADDLDVIVDQVRKRVGHDKVVLVGHSWGTMLGVLYASRHPEKVAAYVGIGQMTDKAKAETLSYNFALDQARRRGNAKAVADLQRIGTPPYGNEQMFTERAWLEKFGGVNYGDMSLLRMIWIGVRVPESNWRDIWAVSHGGAIGTKLLEAQMLSTNLDQTYTSFQVPVFIGAGRTDHVTDADLTRQYFERIDAPQKSFLWFERSGHNPHLEEPEKFNNWMITEVRPVAVAHEGATNVPRSTSQ